LLESKKELIEQLAEKLLEKETLSLPEIVEVLGQRPFKMKDSLKDYLQELKDRDDQSEELAEKEREQDEAAKKEMRSRITFDADAVEDENDDPEDDMAVKIDSAPAKKDEKTEEKSVDKNEEKKDDDKKEK